SCYSFRLVLRGQYEPGWPAGVTRRCPCRGNLSPLPPDGGAPGVQPTHRDQAQPGATDLGQQPVQCGLVREQADDDRLGAVVAELEAAEPVRPLIVRDAVDADLVASRPPGGVHSCPSCRWMSGSPACYEPPPGAAVTRRCAGGWNLPAG